MLHTDGFNGLTIAGRIDQLKPGTHVVTEEGSIGEVISTQGLNVLVHYLECPFRPDLVGKDILCSDYEIISSV